MKIFIYKLYCLNSEVSEIYIGSTKDCAMTKRSHKTKCNNEKSHTYKFKVYQFIRANGGYSNWKMEIFDEYDVEDDIERFIIERSFTDMIEPELNDRNPYETEEQRKLRKREYSKNNKGKITCECGSICRRSDKARHENTNKHKKYLITHN